MKRLFLFSVLLCLTALLCTGCGAVIAPSTEETDLRFFAMDTAMDLKAYGAEAEQALQTAQAEVQRMEGLFSATLETSEIAAANHSGGQPVPVSPDTEDLLAQGLALSWEVGPALDFTLFPVTRAWGFTAGDYRIPGSAELAGLLENVDDSRVLLDSKANTLTVPAGAELDLGAVAKGYTGDRLAALMKKQGVSSALFDLGTSTLRTVGLKPDGTEWTIALRDPRDTAAYAGMIQLGEGAINTSGGYQRYFEGPGGELYWHILDPRTGAPAKTGLLSATVLTEQALYGDGLSTALFVMGLEDAIAYWRSRQDFEFILIDEAGDLFVSEGAASRFSPTGSYENSILVVVTREPSPASSPDLPQAHGQSHPPTELPVPDPLEAVADE